MTHKQALIDLLDKVKAGRAISTPQAAKVIRQAPRFSQAYDGQSVDAGLILLKALAPNFMLNKLGRRYSEPGKPECWGVELLEIDATGWHVEVCERVNVWAETPSRAILIATLEAIIAKEGE